MRLSDNNNAEIQYGYYCHTETHARNNVFF